ncbi:MAG: hypothetical protein ACODAU_09545 [Myxococcota bacterium]
MHRSALPLLLLLSGCLVQNMSAQEHLRDAVTELNEGLRWNRMDVAVPRVAPAYRERFVTAHREWGQSMQIADAELVGVRIEDDRSEAVSTVAVRWYGHATMTVRQAVIEQRWQRLRGGYFLVEERVVRGDPKVLASPPEVEPEPPTSGA